MTTIMYGTKHCPDVRAALVEMADKGLDIEFRNFDDSVAYLKEFVLMRDKRAEFADKKENGYLGIPCFVTEDGKIFFELKDIL